MRTRAGELIDRLPYQLGVAALATGLALSPAEPGQATIAALLVAGLLAGLGRPRVGAVCTVLVVAGAGVGELRLRAIDGPSERLEPFTAVDVRAFLLERPRQAASGRSRAAMRLASGAARGAKVLAVVDGPWRGPADPGAEVRTRGILKPPVRAEGEGFDWPAHLRRHGISLELHADRIDGTGGHRHGIAGIADSARRRAEAAMDAALPPGEAALIRGMVLGEDEAIDPLTRDDWRDAGLAHLLAVSGQNVMLLCALALPFLVLAGASPPARVAILLVLIALYVPLAGAGPSLQRAAVMGAAGLMALAASRPASAAYGLLLAAVATLAVNPRVTGDPGWQLSFAAVAAILIARPVAPRAPVRAALWLTAVASVATTPLLALHFETVPLVSIPANLAALPAVAPVMWIGMVEAALGQLAALGGVGEAAVQLGARVLALLAEPLLSWLQAVASRAAETPHAVAAVRLPGAGAALAAYAVLGAAVWGGVRLARRAAPQADALRVRLAMTPRATLAALALAGAAALIVAGRVAAPSVPDRLTVSFLDVGQGDATLVQHPDGSAVLFDGGRAEARVARLLRQSGVRRLSAVVATHASADHHGGLAEVVRRMPVDVLLDGGDGTRDPAFRDLLRAARARGVRIERAEAGRTLRAGGLAVRVLSPGPRPPGPPPEDPNPRAVVAIVSSGAFDLMLSADAESPTLAGLALPDVEALKVPHHGSGDPGLATVLRTLRPEVAVIEVGENSYGHPHPQTVATLERHVPHVRRTDRDGTVRLTVAGDRMLLD